MTLTIDDIRNPERKSGFDHVVSSGARRWWRAQSGTRPHSVYERDASWRGPVREWPERAAADYVDYVNTGWMPLEHTVVRTRPATAGWFDVVKEDGDEWIDTPPPASSMSPVPRSIQRGAPERAFMLGEAFLRVVHHLPPNCVAEAKASASLSALQYGTGQVLVKRALRGLDHLPAFLIVPVEPHPDHKAAVERLGVKVVVP